ncbi:MAG: hypothetical protein DMG67_05970 [Acidobacteria bacterium]|nr:MAG: hypothetical protein DMG67_05970 [Acidobacteriota bacterium]
MGPLPAREICGHRRACKPRPPAYVCADFPTGCTHKVTARRHRD